MTAHDRRLASMRDSTKRCPVCRMTASARRLPSIALSATVAASLLLAGCDNEPALRDRALAREVARQRSLAAGLLLGDATTDSTKLDAITQKLDSVFAAAENHATKAQAKAMSAQLSYQSARLALVQLEQARTRVDLLLNELSQLTNRLDSLATEVAGANALNPQPLLASVGEQLMPQARGDGNRETWMPFDTGIGGLPTLSGTQQRKSAFESDIARRKEQIAQLSRQRDSLNEQAAEALRQSESEKGRASVDSFRRSADLRQQADNVAAQLLLLQAEIIPLQASLDLTVAQEEQVKTTLAGLESLKNDADASWLATQQQIQSLDQFGLTLVAGSDAGTFSVEGRIVELNRELEELARTRDAALAALKKASDDYNSAAAAADALRRDPAMANLDSTAPEAAAWKTLTDVAVAAPGYRLDEAFALQTTANALVAEASQLAFRARVCEGLVAVAARLPEQSRARLNTVLAQLPASVVEERDKAITQAEAIFKQADELLEGITAGRVAMKTVQDGAKALRVLNLYGQAQVEQVKAISRLPFNYAAKRGATLEYARQLRAEGMELPNLPPVVRDALRITSAPAPVAPDGN